MLVATTTPTHAATPGGRGRRRPGPRPTELNAITIQDSESATDRVTVTTAAPGLLPIGIRPRLYRASALAIAAAATIAMQSMIPNRRDDCRPIVASSIDRSILAHRGDLPRIPWKLTDPGGEQ
jgi:hypothetical protein